MSRLASKFGTPLYVYSASAIRDSYQSLKEALNDLPVQVCFAVKANSNIHILKLIQRLGAGADLVSFGEWARAELAGVPRKKRVLSGVAKTVHELSQLFEFENAGVGSIHVESLMELELLVLMANLKQRPIVVALRYNPDVDAKTIEQISTGRKKDKFGLTASEVLAAVDAYGFDPFVKIDGISIHIGSQITQLGPYRKAFSSLRALSIEVEKKLGRRLGYVDVGGGMGVSYHLSAKSKKSLSLRSYADLVRKNFSDAQKILMEPGRSLVANAGVLVSEVVYSKTRKGSRTLILDSGMNDLMRPALYDAHHEILPLVRESRLDTQPWDVVGGICETTDVFAKGRKLAIEGMPGELVGILSAGAYGFSMSNTYNSKPRAAEVLVDGKKVRLIRSRETVEDLVAREL